MPPKKASKLTLASHLASSSSEGEDSSLMAIDVKPLPNRTSPVETSATKKSRGRPRKQGVLTSSQATQESGDLIAPASEPAVGTKKQRSSKASTSNPTEHPTAPTAVKKRKAEDRNVNTKQPETDEEIEVTEEHGGQERVRVRNAPGTRGRLGKPTKAASRRKTARRRVLEVPETQTVDEHIDSEDEDLHDPLFEESDAAPPYHDTTATRERQTPTMIANADALADELVQLKIRYEKLRHLKIDQGNSIQEEQIQALQEQDRASQRIIENLKSELKSRSIAFQQFQEKDKRIQELEEQQTAMETKIERLLQDHAILSAKLETARNSTKAIAHNTKAAIPAAATKEFSHHRDNLYSDLCGLIVVNVKTDEDGGVEYDCLSTGRNGALHFKLQLDAEEEDDDDDAEDNGPFFTYNPILERGRDERLIAVLPEIFRDEMNFQRTSGVEFYLRLMQSLQLPA
ncbi:hypothetical protein H072_5299 [Dactylellina haptotyla CBS 200.50]|uniref:Monopolin complex subunit Csm1/Pcs1 C-terminal domain-containing protein n=1 Tax=Dactylellina haptotyla (strain CBS 200.50) TaxID=1284197 RepID=S8BZK6_DACHA|nr:hypothetical protein H072_5299 [Dactylellina haptotyla CBS 200.50]